jgi:hypothetical protein
MGEELSRLLAAGVVLVPKKSGKWQMCVDYTSLNKACLKDPFPLFRINQVIDLTTGCELLSFLEAYSGYHQISLAKADQPTTIHHPLRLFLLCEDVVPAEECGGHLLVFYAVLLQGANRAQPESLR